MKKSLSFVLFFILIFNFQSLLAQENELNEKLTREQVNDSIQKMSRFSIYKDNYFITGIPLNEKVDRQSADVKYNVSFKQLITRNTLPWDTYLFVTYSQKSFWNIYDESSPFKEINFNPSIGLGKPIYNKNDRLTGVLSLMFEHESNGRDSIYSRSWNNLHLSYRTSLSEKSKLKAKVWLPFQYKEGNPDLLEYIGLAELTYSRILIPEKLEAEVMVRKGLNWEWKGAIRTRIYYTPFKDNNQGFMLELFNGYSESLINYTDEIHSIRLGYVIRSKDLGLLN